MKTRLLLQITILAFLGLIPVKISAQWVQSTFPTSNHVTDMMFYGNMLYVATYENGIYQTQDFETWSPINNGLTTQHINQIISSVEGAFVSFYVATDAGVFRSTMMGYSWTPVNNGLTNLNISTIFSDGEILYAGTQQGAFRSLNFGQSWLPVTIGAPSQTVDCFYKNGPDLLAGLYGSGEYLYRSIDNGITWNPYGTGLYETNQIAKLDDELFTVSITIMYHSLDNGASWNQVGPGLVPGMPIFDITTGYDYLWIATMAGGFIQHTDSINFRPITSSMPLGGTGLSAVALNEEWIVFGSVNNGIWYEPLDIITDLNEADLNNSVITCLPNPTSGVISIKSLVVGPESAVGSRQSAVVEILDLNGKTLELRNPEPGLPAVGRNLELDLSNYPAGVYFIRMSMDNELIVKKIVKL